MALVIPDVQTWSIRFSQGLLMREIFRIQWAPKEPQDLLQALNTLSHSAQTGRMSICGASEAQELPHRHPSYDKGSNQKVTEIASHVDLKYRALTTSHNWESTRRVHVRMTNPLALVSSL